MLRRTFEQIKQEYNILEEYRRKYGSHPNYQCSTDGCWCNSPDAFKCKECNGTGSITISSCPHFPEHGTLEQERCSECNGTGEWYPEQ